MKNDPTNRWLKSALVAVGMASAAVGGTGCQISTGGQTLPSPYYIEDDVQFFPRGPEFKLQREANALKQFKASQQLGP